MMKQQTAPPNSEIEGSFLFEASKWFDVKGSEKGNKDHYVSEQGSLVCEMIKDAFNNEENPDIFIISPFTSVVHGVKRELSEYYKNNSNGEFRKKVRKWMGTHIGTVHTFQGKEANEVIFMLGCDNSEAAAGAIHWVSNNIVNVAVTRAKYRLYVVGDWQAWEKSECVRVMQQKIIRG